MTALAQNKPNPLDHGRSVEGDVAAAVHCYHGALLSKDTSGNLRPARADVTDIVVGICEKEADNSSGLAGDLTTKATRDRVGFFENADSIAKADFFKPCYVVDDQTVAKSSSGGTRPPAGIVLGLEGTRVRVWIGQTESAGGDLLAANDLSDVDDAPTARANIGANKIVITRSGIPLDADGTFYIAAPPVGGTIVGLRTVVEGATTTTGAANVALEIDGTPVTNGDVDIAIGAVVGEQDSNDPTAANVIADGEGLEIVVTANSQDASATATVTIEIEH